MNQELIDMAKEVGLLNETDEEYFVKVLRIEAFAALVAAAEREACAKLCENLLTFDIYSIAEKLIWDVATIECCDVIRARGKTE